MTKENLLKRVKEITTAVENALANYHALSGRLCEAKFILEELEKGEYLKAAEDSLNLSGEVVQDVSTT